MIGVIADDLTGAAELGAAGWRYGLRAEIVRCGQPNRFSDLVCVDTNSRSCAPRTAARRAADAAKWLRASGAKWIYKKVDSALRGNVTAEVEAVMLELGLTRALLLPANPSLGRVIREGRYFVRGRPIHLTEFARDPEYPRRSSQVMRLLNRPKHFQLKLAKGFMPVPDNTLLLGHSESPDQVRQWAEERGAALLPVGGSDYFDALLAAGIIRPRPATVEEMDLFQGTQLHVCGTASKSVETLMESAGTQRVPVFGLPRELARGERFRRGARESLVERIAEAFGASRRVILCVGLPRVTEISVARNLAEQLVEVAELVLRSLKVNSVFSEGGATSAALVRRMEWSCMEVRREWARGVATLAVDGNGTRWLTIKPGSYAWPDTWTPMPASCGA